MQKKRQKWNKRIRLTIDEPQDESQPKKGGDVTVNETPLHNWLEAQRDFEMKKEALEIQKSESKVPRYIRQTVKYPLHKEKDGRVRSLTRDQIMKEYGMDAMGELTQTQKVIWVLLFQNDENGLTIDEICKKTGLDNVASPSGIISNVWKHLGDERGCGFLTRYRDKDKANSYRYFKTKKADDLTFEQVMSAYYENAKKIRGEARFQRPEADKMVRTKAAASTANKASQPEPKPESEPQMPQAPSNIPNIPEKVDVNITIRFYIGFM